MGPVDPNAVVAGASCQRLECAVHFVEQINAALIQRILRFFCIEETY